MAEIDMTNIRYISNSEPHDETTYNRPVKDLADETELVLVDHQQQITDARAFAVAMAIALG